MYEHTYPEKRFSHTMAFVKKHVSPNEKILDLGVPNPFSELMQKEGFHVRNTAGEDLDWDSSAVEQTQAQVVTAFEIFEHLLNPFTVLHKTSAQKILITVPLRLWFAPAYRSKTDPWDRHYHEFEDWQLDWLLEKTGWKITDREYWTHPVKKFGFRPLLRRFTPRYYAVCAERIR